MRKLSILIALILCVTIGGVYATWNYAQGNVASTTKYASMIITDKVVDTAKGTITVDTSNLIVTIDDSNNDFKGEMALSGYVTVTFTPNTGADEDVSSHGIPLQYSLGTTTNYTFRAENIYSMYFSSTKRALPRLSYKALANSSISGP